MTSPTDMLSLLHSCSIKSSINSLVSEKCSLTSSSSFMALLILFCPFCFSCHVLCFLLVRIGFNLKYLKVFILLWLVTPWLLRLLNLVIKRCDWVLKFLNKVIKRCDWFLKFLGVIMIPKYSHKTLWLVSKIPKCSHKTL